MIDMEGMYYADHDYPDDHITKGTIVYYLNSKVRPMEKPAGADVPLTENTTLGELYDYYI